MRRTFSSRPFRALFRITGILLTSSFVGKIALAGSDCTPMRLDDTSMKSMPVYDQKDVADCYAITTAQMIDAYRFSHGDTNTEHRTSHYALATKYKAMSAQDRKKLVCNLKTYMVSPEERAPAKDQSRPLNFKKESYVDSHLEIGAPEEAAFANRVAGGKVVSCSENAVNRYFKQNKNFKETFDLWSQTKDANTSEPLCKDETRLDMKQIVESVKDAKSAPDFFAGVMKRICENNSIKVDFPDIVTLGWTVPGERVGKREIKRGKKYAKAGVDLVNGALSLENPQPVGIGYYSDFLKKKTTKIDGEFHNSVIIGRRQNKAGQCEFLLRNSWGNKCDLTVACDPRTKGQYWINAEELMLRVEDVTLALDPAATNKFLAQESNKGK